MASSGPARARRKSLECLGSRRIHTRGSVPGSKMAAEENASGEAEPVTAATVGADSPSPAAGVEAHRAHRSRRAWYTTLTALAGRAVAMLLSLASVPLTLGLLDRERFGLWIMIGSMLQWLTIADLGLGYGLTKGLVDAGAKNDRTAEREIVSTSMLAVGAVALAMAVSFALAFPFAPWAKILAVSSGVDTRELHLTIAISAGIFFLGFPLGLIDKIYAGHQEGYVNNYWGTVTNVASLVALVAAVRLGRGLPTLVLALSGVPLVVRLVNTGYLFGWRRPWLRPSFRSFRLALAKQQLRLGGAFLFVQLVALAMWQNDNIIVAQLFGVSEVAPYSLAFRLGGFYIGMLSIWLDPLWPAYADAAARGDHEWIREKLRRTVTLGVAATLAAGVVVLIWGATVIRLWARSATVLPDRGMLVGVAGYMLVMAWLLPHAVVLNGLGRIRSQMIYGSICAVVNVGLSFLLGRRFGPAGVGWATCLSALIAAVGVPLDLHAHLRALPAAAPKGAS